MNDDEDRIRQEAHKLWEQEGRPDGRSERHWAEAREIIALRDSNQTTLKPVQETLEEPAEPVLAVENLGDLPGITDQGDEKLAPSYEAAKDVADEAPLVTDEDVKKEKGSAKNRAKSAEKKAGASADKPASDKKKGAAKDEAKGASKRSKSAGA
ncbi:DUF2934 domain-containing protein [Aureimonas psammosilenae]|uniref:DUF2934 domain-containing protein n=1 Tax=Aureimonas psammosilenae TaxID=2495496 RepID=UPI001260D951|nr:DUF2934 domain-containing protein [Aureimonas psammosilenae]